MSHEPPGRRTRYIQGTLATADGTLNNVAVSQDRPPAVETKNVA